MSAARAPVASWARVSELLDEALDLSPPARPAWLSALQQREPALAPDVARLLAAHTTQSTHDPLARLPALGRCEAPDATHGLAAGQRVGPWTLLAPLGAGGMAVVWRAARADGAYRREVALKLPQRLPWRDDLAARLARERDILARLEHPHIARFYDAGVEHDHPWLAMELVDAGLPITAWCDAHRLGVRERVRLFLQVLDAVAHAHAALVLHRDLKPSNILVMGGGPRADKGQVKLLDFGIAKLIDGDQGQTADTRLTQLGGRAMTPDYASPEQIRGEPLTTASDVYALGVVLCELLCGELPYRLRRRSAAQVETAVLDVPPTRPSARPAAEAAQARGLSTRALARTLRGELDAIVLAALRKSPTERYGSAAALREDLQRWLDGLPVRARPDSRWYRARAFVRRHRVGVTMGAALAAVLLVTTAVSVRQSLLAEREALRARATRDFLLALYKPVSWLSANPSRGGQVTARELLDMSAERLHDHPIDDPEVQRDVLATLADLYFDVGDAARRAGVTAELMAYTEQHFGPRSPEHFDALVRYSVAISTRDMAASVALLDKAASLIDAIPGSATLARARYWMARGVLTEDSDPAVAEQAFGTAIELLRGQAGQGQDLSRALIGLARVRWLGQNRLPEARALYEQALALLRAEPGVPPFALTKPQAELADVLSRLGELGAARALYEEAHVRSREGLGAGHVDTVQTGMRVARARRETGQPLQALTSLEGLRDTLRSAAGPEDVYTLPSVHRELADTRAWLGRWDEAERDMAQALAGLARRNGNTVNDTVALWWAALAAVQAEAGRADAAQRSMAEAQGVPDAVAQVPRVQRAWRRAEAVGAVMGLAARPQAYAEAQASLERWQKLDLSLIANAAPAARARAQANLAVWRARAALWAARPADAAQAVAPALAALGDPITTQIGGIERAQLQSLLAQALLAQGQRGQACQQAAAAVPVLTRDLPGAPEQLLAARLLARCGQAAAGAARQQVSDAPPSGLPRLLAVPAWRLRDQAVQAAFGPPRHDTVL